MNTAERVVDILDAVASSDGPCGISELSRQLKIGKYNVFRILSALEEKGWIEQDTETKKYSLTGAMAGVAFRALSQLDIQKVSLPYLQELQKITGETSALVIREELGRMFISCIPSDQAVRHVVPVGERGEQWRGSGGKAILAFTTEDEIEAVLKQFRDSGVQTLAAGQTVTVESLREELALIRKQGFAVGVGERNSGVCGVSAPIFNHQQRVVGSISVSGPMPRFDMEKAFHYSDLIMEKAKKISSILGAKVESLFVAIL
ncbi:MAG: IclR family transcriptional regulator [Deltaproteobacteria bacterium]|nr:IclR family transcriptional regulator [Deltaproteobacteria bacterium]